TPRGRRLCCVEPVGDGFAHAERRGPIDGARASARHTVRSCNITPIGEGIVRGDERRAAGLEVEVQRRTASRVEIRERWGRAEGGDQALVGTLESFQPSEYDMLRHRAHRVNTYGSTKRARREPRRLRPRRGRLGGPTEGKGGVERRGRNGR